MLEPAAYTCELNEISLMNGYAASARQNILRIGVDISTIMNECIAAEHGSHLYMNKPGGPLRIFFFKLCKFLRAAPAILIFVFDGPNRPAFKHGRVVNTQTAPEWADSCKRIIEAFGYHWHQAPGEAEAELAMLSRYNVVDIVMTSDSDCLVFGAQCVLQSSTSPGLYRIYAMDAIEHTPDVSLTRGGLVLVALLSGSDYSTGLAGCGIKRAICLARGGFGDAIVSAFETLQGIELDRKLESIAAAIHHELYHNTRHLFKSTQHNLASKFDASFISHNKIALYLAPIISVTSREHVGSIPTWIKKEPIVPHIAQFCYTTLGWTPDKSEKKLRSILWPGIALQLLISPLLMFDELRGLYATPRAYTKVLHVSTKPRKGIQGEWTQLTLSVTNFIALLGLPETLDQQTELKMWISTQYLSAKALRGMGMAPAPSADSDQQVTHTSGIAIESGSGADHIRNSQRAVARTRAFYDALVDQVVSISDSSDDDLPVRLCAKRKCSPEIIVISD